MGQTTSNISIYIPAAGETNYDQSFAAGMVNIDQHDHSGGPNKGVQITAASIGAGAVTYKQLNADVIDTTTGLQFNAGLLNQIQLAPIFSSMYQIPFATNGYLVKNGATTSTTTNFNSTTQPSFSASVGSGTQSSKTGNSTPWLVRFNTVQFDQASNFTVGSDPTGSLFTAPSNGIYLFTVDLDMSYTTPAGLSEVQLEFVSAGLPGGANTIFDINPFPVLDPSNHTVINASQIIQLTATQTIQVRVTAYGMAGDTASISGGFFTGCQLC